MMNFSSAEQEVYKERYASELERRGQINDRADAQVTLLTVFVAIVAYYVSNFPSVNWNWRFMTFGVFFAVLCVGTIAAGFFVVRLVWCDTASYLPNPKDAHKYHQGLVQWHRNADPVNGQSAAEDGIKKQLDEDFFHAANANAQRNDFRDHKIFQSKRWILIALIGLIPTAILHFCISATTIRGDNVSCTCTHEEQSNGR